VKYISTLMGCSRGQYAHGICKGSGVPMGRGFKEGFSLLHLPHYITNLIHMECFIYRTQFLKYALWFSVVRLVELFLWFLLPMDVEGFSVWSIYCIFCLFVYFSLWSCTQTSNLFCPLNPIINTASVWRLLLGNLVRSSDMVKHRLQQQ